jgi:hypothetical protein
MSAKSRNSLRRKVRRLFGDAVSGDGCGVDLIEARSVGPDSSGLVRITAPADVPWLVQRMSEISRKTYQYNLLGLGVRDADWLAREASSAAEQGWLRSYILMDKGRAVAFLYGMQFPAEAARSPGGDTCHYLDVGHDPAWSALSAGTVLQYLVVRDLWEYRRPEVFDFGPGHAVHKERFGNESYLEVDLYLFCRTARARWARSAHASCTHASNMAGRVLNGLGVKDWVRRAVRRLGSVEVSGASTPGSWTWPRG